MGAHPHLEDLLQQKPELIEARYMLLRAIWLPDRTARLAGIPADLRESRRMMPFEAAAYLERMGMDWEAQNARMHASNAHTAAIDHHQQQPILER